MSYLEHAVDGGGVAGEAVGAVLETGRSKDEDGALRPSFRDCTQSNSSSCSTDLRTGRADLKSYSQRVQSPAVLSSLASSSRVSRLLTKSSCSYHATAVSPDLVVSDHHHRLPRGRDDLVHRDLRHLHSALLSPLVVEHRQTAIRASGVEAVSDGVEGDGAAGAGVGCEGDQLGDGGEEGRPDRRPAPRTRGCPDSSLAWLISYCCSSLDTSPIR